LSERLGLYGGAFDPPHRGHVELVRRAKEAFGLDRVVVLVVADPGHKHVATPAAARLAMARAAFPDDEVVLDEHPRTVDTLRAHPEWRDAIFLIGADQFCDFPSWKEPEVVLRLVRVGVATRPGFPRERLDDVLERLAAHGRVLFYELDPVPLSSRELRTRLEHGDAVDEDLPAAVTAVIRAEGLYARARG
jgi:nicotinate-nucleotide adenylyltransferase